MKMALPEQMPTLRAMASGNFTRVDNVFISDTLFGTLIKCTTHPQDLPPNTDHLPIETELDITAPLVDDVPRRNFRAVDWDKFIETLQGKIRRISPPTRITTLGEFRRRVKELDDVVDKTVEEKVPLSRPCPHSKRWWSPELRKARQETRRVGRTAARFMHAPDHPAHQDFQRKRNEYARLLIETKQKHWAEWLLNIGIGDMWTASRLVSGAIPQGGRTRVPMLKVKDPVTGETRQIADNAEKGKTFYNTFFPPKPATSSVPADPKYPPPAWEFVNIDETQIHRAIAKMQPYKGTKQGTWPNVVFQKAADLIVPYLTPIHRAVFELETYHKEWASTGTLAHRKPGKPDYSVPEAWRPIVLSVPWGRLLNSCVRDQVSTMAERKGIFPSHHFGGRPGRNTTDALHLLLKVVMDAWRRGRVASILSLDVKGAFPSTDVDRLQHNMRMRGIPEEIVGYMGRRLACRKTQLLFDDFVSEEFVVDAGLDQGDPFSPTAYLLYNSDHLAIADPKNGEHVFVFIDDTTLVAVGDSFEETHEKLGHLMEKENGIFAWATEHNCAFGTNKFQLLDLSRRREPEPDNPRKRRPITRTPLNSRGLEIPSRSCIKLLGVEIDNELRWKQQGAVAIKTLEHHGFTRGFLRILSDQSIALDPTIIGKK